MNARMICRIPRDGIASRMRKYLGDALFPEHRVHKAALDIDIS